jgi:RNA polymerase sigma-70 factor (ECF subfamily)
MDDQSGKRLRGLMVRYQAGEYEAFEELYGALHGRIRAQVRSRVRNTARADDLTQEVFLQLHRGRHTYDPAYPVLPWVFAIARHVLLMDLRTTGRRPRFVAQEETPEPAVQADAAGFVEGAPVRDALTRVSSEKREAMLLHHVEGWSFREIARRLGIRESAAKLRSSRGVKQLRNLLKK